MVEDTLKRIEREIIGNDNLSQEKKQQLTGLLTELKEQILNLNNTNTIDAASIANYAETSIREATRQEKSSELLSHSIEGLSLYAKKFEVSHPTLIGVINTIGQTLVNIGV